MIVSHKKRLLRSVLCCCIQSMLNVFTNLLVETRPYAVSSRVLTGYARAPLLADTP